MMKHFAAAALIAVSLFTAHTVSAYDEKFDGQIYFGAEVCGNGGTTEFNSQLTQDTDGTLLIEGEPVIVTTEGATIGAIICNVELFEDGSGNFTQNGILHSYYYPGSDADNNAPKTINLPLILF